MDGWNDFYVAIAGAAAALTGLIFVGISINLTKIVSNVLLPIRASISLILLLSILVFSLIFLIPQKSLTLIGTEVLLVACVVWWLVTRADYKIYKNTPKEYKKSSLVFVIIDQVAVIPYIICGFSILCIGENGFYWMVPALILSFIKAVVDAWILLIEINR